MDNFAKDLIQNLSKMDLTADIAQKSCLMSDLKLIHILSYIKYKKMKVISEGACQKMGGSWKNANFNSKQDLNMF